ncbi:hypothetical protein WOC04_23565, partial [Vibrio parahaemolyticus]
MQPIFSSLGGSFRFLGKSALFANASSVGLPQSRFGSFAFALSFPKVIYQNFRVFKSHEMPQS